MKILSVIPARAGSRGIPNKNIRMIHGHPMVFYSIKNALDSKYITDVVVTTDSYEVMVLAEQMGARCRWRSEELCGDDVTLDAVIYDVVESEEMFYDYVITMQPTSPTLTVESLDKAINYTIEKGLETLISARNQPHLSWSESGGKKIQNYKRRLNRQFLPPCYVETGAFIISKYDVISATNRIGENVDIFELSEKEAIDVDTFIDMYSAEEVLSQKSVAIYVNGNKTRGTGHVYRALEIADEFLTKPDIFYDCNQTKREIFGDTTHNLIPVHGIVELFQIIKNKKYEIFINDILATSLDYMIGVRSVMPLGGKIVNFEDDGEGASKADAVFNALNEDESKGKIYGGFKYYIAPKLFMMYSPIKIKENVRNVFICFGGADPQNYTDKLIKIITKGKYKKFIFFIALGRAYENVDVLMEYNDVSNINVFYNVKDMPEMMSNCDIAITSRGRTAYELAMLGVPSIVLSQNEREERHGFICDSNGFRNIGIEPTEYMIESTLDNYLAMPQRDRIRIQELLLKYDLKSGRKRVAQIIHSL